MWIEFVDLDALHVVVRAQGLDVDHIVGLRLFLAQPSAGLTDCDPPLVTRLEQLRGLVGRGRHVVADQEGQDHENAAQGQEQPQRAPGIQAAGAQNRVFRALRQPGHDEDRSDQHRDGQQLVQAIGQQQADVEQNVAQLVGGAIGAAAAAQVLQLVGQIEKQKQGQKAAGDQRNRQHSLAIDQFAQGFHAPAPWRRRPSKRPRRVSSDQARWRLINQSTAAAKKPPCRTSIMGAKLMTPLETQFWLKVIRLL